MTLIVGGLDRTMQVDELVANPDIVIATPGRLIDHLRNTESFNLSDIEVLVVDEADRILDNFFVEQLTEIVRQCCSTRQTMLFSATMTEEIKELVVMSLKKPVRVCLSLSHCLYSLKILIYSSSILQNLELGRISTGERGENEKTSSAPL